MRWNTGGGNYRKYTPQELKDLPLELQRSHQYTRDPEAVVDSVQDYLEGKPKPEYLPQQLAFRRNQTPPWKQAWLSGTIALLAAKKCEREKFAALRAAGGYGVPTKPMDERGQELERMPMPLDRTNPDMDRPVIAQGMTSAGKLSSDDITRLGRQHEIRIQQLGELRAGAAADAINDVKAQVTQLNAFVSVPK